MSQTDRGRDHRAGTPSPTGSGEDEATAWSEGGAAELMREFEAGRLSDRRSGPDRRAIERRRHHLWKLFLFFAVAIAVMLVLPQYLIDVEGNIVDPPPDELLGTWSTDAPRYADRFITIGRDQLTLGLGGGGQATYPVRSIRVEAADVHRRYEVEYEDPDGGVAVLQVFVYDDGLLRLRNPSEVQWRREPD